MKGGLDPLPREIPEDRHLKPAVPRLRADPQETAAPEILEAQADLQAREAPVPAVRRAPVRGQAQRQDLMLEALEQ